MADDGVRRGWLRGNVESRMLVVKTAWGREPLSPSVGLICSSGQLLKVVGLEGRKVGISRPRRTQGGWGWDWSSFVLLGTSEMGGELAGMANDSQGSKEDDCGGRWYLGRVAGWGCSYIKSTEATAGCGMLSIRVRRMQTRLRLLMSALTEGLSGNYRAD